MLLFRGSGDIKTAIRHHFESRTDLYDRIVVDLPAGKGSSSGVLRERGARVEAYDLFPQFFEAEGVVCTRADLRGRLPIADRHADLVLFQEAIEHLPDPLGALMELNRILKPGGRLILTTPNVSHLRARFSQFFVQSELYNRLPATELDAVWFSDAGQRYFGHLFVIAAPRLRVLARIAGFRLAKIHPVKASVSSLILGISYPLILAFNLFAYLRSAARTSKVETGKLRRVYREMLRLNLHPTVLFGKHLFWELEKEGEADRFAFEVYKDAGTIC